VRSLAIAALETLRTGVVQGGLVTEVRQLSLL
jgi:hypothetical protein